jgi:hypothetical protein
MVLILKRTIHIMAPTVRLRDVNFLYHWSHFVNNTVGICHIKKLIQWKINILVKILNYFWKF